MATLSHMLGNRLFQALLISLVTAFVTVRLSFGQFRSQKLLERKWDAYSRIMEQLTLLELLYSSWYDDATSAKVLSKERKDSMVKQHMLAEESVRKAAAAGSFIVSAETASALADLVKDFDSRVQGEHWVDEIGRN